MNYDLNSPQTTISQNLNQFLATKGPTITNLLSFVCVLVFFVGLYLFSYASFGKSGEKRKSASACLLYSALGLLALRLGPVFLLSSYPEGYLNAFIKWLLIVVNGVVLFNVYPYLTIQALSTNLLGELTGNPLHKTETSTYYRNSMIVASLALVVNFVGFFI